MSRSEALAIISNSSDEDLGDVLLEMAAEYWLERGQSPEEFVELAELAVEEVVNAYS